MNQRWPALFLALILFCGCGGPEIAPTEPIPATKPRSSLGFYDFPEAPELATDPAIQSFPLDTEDVFGIRFLGDDILLFSGYEKTRLTLLTGETLCVKAEVTLTCSADPDAPGVTVSENGVTYVDPDTRDLVFLAADLSETRRISLPKVSGNVLLSADQTLLYYCTSDTLQVLDLNTGINRLIRATDFLHQELIALHRDDTVAQCVALCEDGSFCTLFFSTETGTLLHETQEDISVWTQGDLYFALHTDGPYRELICGSTHFGPSVFALETEVLDMTPVLTRKCILIHSQTSDQAEVLDRYHLETGVRTAHVVLPEEYRITDICPDPDQDLLWILCRHSLTGANILCCWDPGCSDPADSANYLQTRWTPAQPDPEGLAQCQQLADTLSEKHGVQIQIWTDATDALSCFVAAQPEHQIPVIRSMLTELDTLLSHYPEGFLKDLADLSHSGQLNICLIRSITGTPEFPVWDENADIWLAVTSQQDLAQQIYLQFASITDSRILSRCNVFDNWPQLNPEDFRYGMGLTDAALISGPARCFVDIAAMDSPHEDRKRILVYAMTDGHAELFSAAPLQAKLRQLCIGIRDAFCLDDSSVIYRWEQYLEEPLVRME